MIIEISLAIIAMTFIMLTSFFIGALLKIKKSVEGIQQDLHHLSTGTEDLTAKLTGLVTDLTKKSQSLNFLFTPLSFLNKKMGSETPAEESSTQNEIIPQLVEWITTSVILVKKSKEFIKHYVK